MKVVIFSVFCYISYGSIKFHCYGWQNNINQPIVSMVDIRQIAWISTYLHPAFMPGFINCETNIVYDRQTNRTDKLKNVMGWISETIPPKRATINR